MNFSSPSPLSFTHKKKKNRTMMRAVLLLHLFVLGPCLGFIIRPLGLSHRGRVVGFASTKAQEVEKLLEEVDYLQKRAFKTVGVFGRPIPEEILSDLKRQGKYGTEGERLALQQVRFSLKTYI